MHKHSNKTLLRSSLLPSDQYAESSASSEPLGSPVYVSRTSSPYVQVPPTVGTTKGQLHEDIGQKEQDGVEGDLEFEDWELSSLQEDDDDAGAVGDTEAMLSDVRPPYHRPTEGRSHTPLLGNKRDDRRSYDSPVRPGMGRRRTFHERDPEVDAKRETTKRYTYAAIFLALSLISFVVQTETAVYIQRDLGWNKAYMMLYLTHGSWSLLWPTQLLIMRLQKRNMPWATFWRRHQQILRTTAQMVEHRTLHPTVRQTSKSPIPYMLKMTAFVTCSLTVAGGSWYVAVDLTTASDLTAIYNCSAFFAYAFSIPLLHEKVRWGKVVAVAVAITGVLVVAYGPKPRVENSDGSESAPEDDEARNRALGNVIIGIGSVLYGFYEVLYKKVACPPEGCSPGRGMIFANTFGSLIGSFTLLVLWIPIPILHLLGWETFVLPRGEQAWMLVISVLANATFSGSFLVLISLTSPVLSSVAALLTIFIVALVDQLLPPPMYSPLSASGVVGGCLIIGAFIMLSWSTYQEMAEERKKLEEEDISDSDVESRLGD